jgi:hypothetical protein
MPTYDDIQREVDQRHHIRDEVARRQAELEGRLRQAYAVAQRSTHAGGRVQLHLGSAVIELLRGTGVIGSTRHAPHAWGFPVVPVDDNPAHISVHIVHDVF